MVRIDRMKGLEGFMTADTNIDEAESDGHGPGYRWFTAGVGSWFAAFGMQGVLFAWILVSELDADSKWVGIAQTSSMLPSLFFLLIGGATADRFDPRRMLMIVHLLAPLPVLALAWAAATNSLSIPLVLSFALCMGTITAFGNPARDALLSRVAGANLMSAVSGMTAVQFGAQAAGALLAATARLLGTATTLILHAVILASGAFFSSKVPKRTPSTLSPMVETSGAPASAETFLQALGGLREGLIIIARSPELRGSLFAIFSVGVFFIGPFGVVLPLMIRDVYSGNVDQFAIAYTLFPLGTISGSLILRRIGLRRKGRAMLFALSFAAIFEGCLGVGLPFWLFCIATLSWGLCGAIFINCSRTIFQEHAPPAYRGRVFAAYQLGFMGGGPIGSLVSGFAIPYIGLGGTFYLGAGAMALILIGMVLFSKIPQID